MKFRLLAGGFVLGVAAALMTTEVLSQDQGKMPSPQEMEQMMKVWADAMKPGEAHKNLMRSAGSWDTTTRTWMGGPDAPPMETKGTAENKEVLGGRFLLETVKFEIPMPTGNMPIEGMGMFGYDNYQKVYVGCWADTAGTQLLTMRGSMSPDGKVLTMFGEMDEPMLGVRGRMVKYVTTIMDDNHHVFQIFDLHAGDNYKVVEVDYRRRK